MDLVVPAVSHLESYSEALAQGWSPDTVDPDANNQQLARIHTDPVAFVQELDDPDGRGDPVVLPNGSKVRRLPSFQRWMWADGFVGSVGFRWQPGTPELPPYVLGHIGYSVVPWARRRGHATAALRQLLGQVVALDLPYVDLTTDVDNIASQKVIAANGGFLVERFVKPAAYGADQPALRWRITISADQSTPEVFDPVAARHQEVVRHPRRMRIQTVAHGGRLLAKRDDEPGSREQSRPSGGVAGRRGALLSAAFGQAADLDLGTAVLHGAPASRAALAGVEEDPAAAALLGWAGLQAMQVCFQQHVEGVESEAIGDQAGGPAADEATNGLVAVRIEDEFSTGEG